MNFVLHSLYLTQRELRGLMRQPIYIAFTLVQPLIWLFLYGQLFKRVVELPGFQTTSYVSFVAPGIVIMTALFGGGWNGMGVIVDLDRGIMDRFLVSPLSRGALIAGRLISIGFISIIQSLVLLTLAFLLGARFDGGLPGLIVLVLSAILLAAPFGALSIALALVVRKEESVIGAANFILLPLTFLSPILIEFSLMPHWIQVASRMNPVSWAVEAARQALMASTDWYVVATRLAMLIVFSLASTWVATRAFRAYQRSV